FGPRIPGTPGHERTGDFILEHLRATADTVAIQSFTHVTRHGATLHLRNFFARFRPTATERVLLLAHWDTRPHADQSANLGQWRRRWWTGCGTPPPTWATVASSSPA